MCQSGAARIEHRYSDRLPGLSAERSGGYRKVVGRTVQLEAAGKVCLWHVVLVHNQ